MVLEHFYAYIEIYDHKPAAVEIKGSIVSQDANSKVPRLDNRWIASRDPTEFSQAVEYATQPPVPHCSLNEHEHRQELINIMHTPAN